MENRSLLRLFGLCSFIGGLMIVLSQIWFYIDPVSFIATYFDHMGWFFITLGIVGLYLIQYRELGGLGFISFLLLSIGMFHWLGYKWFLTYAAPDLRKIVPELLDSGLQSVLYGIELSNYILQVGFFLFAVISLFKGILSRWGLSLLLIGSALAFNTQMEADVLYSPLIPQVMIGLAFVWIGFSMFTGDQENSYDEDGIEEITELRLTEPLVNETENSSVLNVHLEDKIHSTPEDSNTGVKKQEVSTT
ncbi:MAG: hypothetical protein WAM95_13000 [Bacillus sp. (in: firmicutes)]